MLAPETCGPECQPGDGRMSDVCVITRAIHEDPQLDGILEQAERE
jgi:hypothetical protein